MNRVLSARLASLALCCALLCGAIPSYAATPASVHVDPVPSHAMVGTTDLFGLTDAEARAVIASESAVPTLSPVVVRSKGRTYTLSADKAVALDVDATLQRAYAASDTVATYTLSPVLGINGSVISAWTNSLATKVHLASGNAYRSLKKGEFVFHPEIVGYQVNKKKTTALLTSVVASEIASPTLQPAAREVPLDNLQPKTTRKNIGKAILIVLSQFRIKLYAGGGLEKSYPCAIGQPSYPTPTGKFKVTGKAKNPTWYNPGSAWARNMPPSISGADGPLGTRAIYTSAPGIRMHGVPSSEDWSIGHRASHGCLRMHRRDVEDLYPRVPVGIDVWIIH
jgi:lipoprotein-anchoring transpeptidase ErfK/SrfK